MATQDEKIKWVEGSPFMVDGFRFTNARCKHYLLTHFHSGLRVSGFPSLSSSNREWINLPIIHTRLQLRRMSRRQRLLRMVDHTSHRARFPLPHRPPLPSDMHVCIIACNTKTGSSFFRIESCRRHENSRTFLIDITLSRLAEVARLVLSSITGV